MALQSCYVHISAVRAARSRRHIALAPHGLCLQDLCSEITEDHLLTPRSQLQPLQTFSACASMILGLCFSASGLHLTHVFIRLLGLLKGVMVHFCDARTLGSFS